MTESGGIVPAIRVSKNKATDESIFKGVRMLHAKLVVFLLLQISMRNHVLS